MSEDLSKADFESLAEFRYALRKFLGFSEDAATKHGVTPQQYQALLAIEGYPGRNWVTIGELAEQLRTTHQSAVGLVDRMEAMQLVARAIAKEDRRRVRVRLSPKGLNLLKKLYLVHRAELRSSGATLASVMQKAAEHIPAKLPVGAPDSSAPKAK